MTNMTNDEMLKLIAEKAKELGDLTNEVQGHVNKLKDGRLPPMKPYYAAKIEMPANKRTGLANAIQNIINLAEAGDLRECLLQAVDLKQDVIGDSNPYELKGEIAYK